MILEENHKVFPSKQRERLFFLVVTEKDVS